MEQGRFRRGASPARLVGTALLVLATVLGAFRPSLSLSAAVETTPTQAAPPSEASEKEALETAWSEVQKLSAEVDRDRIVPNFGKKAQAILKQLEERLGSSSDIAVAIDGALEALFLRQLLLVEEKLGKRYLHTAPAKALEKAEKSFSEAAKELLRPDSEWSYEPAQKDFSNDFAQALRHQVSLSHERMRTAQTQRATADVIGKIQKQLDSFADKLRGTTSGPWSLWTSYRLPGTPIQVSGRYQDGRTNVMFDLVPNKDPANAEAGFVDGLTPQNLGLSLNVGI
ncbi:unnamed protein product [Durusdinium trenchii]|uniref:Uncharacterized protein n=1 Tax=Durusdinium trenchii TaxID=1381693 RepID=A0ABP0NGI0_9DINO